MRIGSLFTGYGGLDMAVQAVTGGGVAWHCEVVVEWMMGLPAGWVTGVGLPMSQQLKLLGNGVVPQQAVLALQLLGAA